MGKKTGGKLVVVWLCAAVVLGWEVPKLKTYMAGEGTTASADLYGLQNPPSPRAWVVLHLLSATYISLYVLNRAYWSIVDPEQGQHLFLVRNQSWKKPPTMVVDYDLFFLIAHYIFIASILLQLGKLGDAPVPLALMINGTLVFLMQFALVKQRALLYFGVLVLPIALTSIAEIHRLLLSFYPSDA